jgi:cell division protein ZapA
MTEAPRPVTVHILEKEYRIACNEDEREALLAAAAFLSGKMKEIRDSGKVVGVDRIAVMAALNITHELLQHDGGKDNHKQSIGARIRTLQEKIEEALTEGAQMEL